MDHDVPDPASDAGYRELFEQLFAASPEAVVVCANDAAVLRVNAEFSRLFGYTEEEAIGRNIDELVAEGLNGLHEHAMDVTRSVAAGKVASVDTKRRRKSGELVDVSILGRAICVDGEQVAIYAIYRDIAERVAMERQLAQENARFEQLFAASPEAVVVCANDGEVLRANEEFTRLFGYAKEEALGRNIDALVAPPLDALRHEARGITQQVADGQSSFVETTRRHKDGRLIHVSILGKPITIDGDQVAVYGIYRDITARVLAEAALAETRRKVERLHEAAVALGEAEGEEDVYRITADAAERVLEFTLGVLCVLDEADLVCRTVTPGGELGESKRMRVNPAGAPARSLASGQAIVIDDPDPADLTIGLPTSSRSLICAPIGGIGVYQAGSPDRGAFDEEDARLLGILLGHTAVAVSRLRLQSELVRQARHDALTGVFNRHYFNEMIAQEVLRASRYDHPIGLLMIDVDRFKEINDRYGHQTGDMVLREIASTLRGTVRATDMLVRYGGDEFLVVLTETGEDSEQAARRIRDAVRENDRLRAISGFGVTVSVGSIFWHPNAACSIEQALAQADRRMYEEKHKS
jgi:diguanylate cyclase (GGDEF)-like protein/PAS domain S-box-containing protein